MHELAITENIVRIVEEQALRKKFSRVNRVRLEIGCLSNVEPEAIAFCFDVATRGTIAEKAGLEILRIAGRSRCRDCGGEMDIDELGTPCSACGGFRREILAGNEIRIKDMEVE